MSEFRFAQPQWLHALWGVLAFVALLFWFELRGVGALDQLIGNALQRRLVRRPSAFKRRMRIALLGLSAFIVPWYAFPLHFSLRFSARIHHVPRVRSRLIRPPLT